VLPLALGADYLYGMEGNDTILGGDGDDVLLGGDGDDILYGDAGRDYLYGEWGIDWLSGGDGDDYLDGGNDGLRDSLVGGWGADQFIRHRTRLSEPGGPVIYYNDPDVFVDISTATGDAVLTIWHYE